MVYGLTMISQFSREKIILCSSNFQQQKGPALCLERSAFHFLMFHTDLKLIKTYEAKRVPNFAF